LKKTLEQVNHHEIITSVNIHVTTIIHTEFRRCEKLDLNSNWWRLWTSISAT